MPSQNRMPPSPGAELTVPLSDSVSVKLILIPAGKFMMGSPNNEKEPPGLKGRNIR